MLIESAAGDVESHPLATALQYEGRRASSHTAKRLPPAVAAAEERVRRCVLAGTAFESGALTESVHSEPAALIDAFAARGVQVRPGVASCLKC